MQGLKLQERSSSHLPEDEGKSVEIFRNIRPSLECILEDECIVFGLAEDKTINCGNPLPATMVLDTFSPHQTFVSGYFQ